MNSSDSEFRSLTMSELRKLPRAERTVYEAKLAERNRQFMEALNARKYAQEKMNKNNSINTNNTKKPRNTVSKASLNQFQLFDKTFSFRYKKLEASLDKQILLLDRQYLFSSFSDAFREDYLKQSAQERQTGYLELLDLPFASTDEYKAFHNYLKNNFEKVGVTAEKFNSLELLRVALNPLAGKVTSHNVPLSLINLEVGAAISDYLFDRKEVLRKVFQEKESELVARLRKEYKDLPFGGNVPVADLTEAQKAKFEEYKNKKQVLLKDLRKNLKETSQEKDREIGLKFLKALGKVPHTLTLIENETKHTIGRKGSTKEIIRKPHLLMNSLFKASLAEFMGKPAKIRRQRVKALKDKGPIVD